MKTSDEIRRENLAILRVRCGGVGQLARQLEKSDAQISQWLNASPDSKSGKPRGMSDDVCRSIEEKFGLERGWMDNSHEGIDSNTDAVDLTELTQLVTFYVQSTKQARQTIMAVAGSAEKLPVNRIMVLPSVNQGQ